MFNKNDLVLRIGKGEFEGRQFTYLYVLVNINGAPTQIKLKAGSKIEKDILIREIGEVDEVLAGEVDKV